MAKKPKLPNTPQQRLLNKENLYIGRLLTRFGVNSLTAKLIDLKTPINHCCTSCKKSFKIAPEAILLQSRPYCTKCLSKNNNVRVLSMDPGLNNFAFVCSKYKFNKDNLCKIKLIKHGFIKNTIRNMAGDVALGILAFIKESLELIEEFKPDLVIIERFQVRGRFMGLTAECVNLMMGLLFYILIEKNIFYFPVTAASWKNELHRRTKIELKELYKIHTPHLIDAFCQGLYKISNDSVYSYLEKHHIKLFSVFKTPKQLKLEAKLAVGKTKCPSPTKK